MSAHDHVGDPAIAETAEGNRVPGTIVGAFDGGQRVNLETSQGPVNTAWERVEPEPRLRGLRRIAARDCNDPDTDSERSTMASYEAVVGRAHALDVADDRDDLDRLLRDAVRAGELLEWSEAEDARWFVPRKESYLRNVIGEENRRAEPSRELIEHCADAIAEVCK